MVWRAVSSWLEARVDLPGVDVDGDQRLRAIDDDGATAGQCDLAVVDPLDLWLELEAGEEGSPLRVAHEPSLGSGHEGPHVLLGLVVGGLVVDEDLLDRGVEVVPEGPQDDVLVAVEQLDSFASPGLTDRRSSRGEAGRSCRG